VISLDFELHWGMRDHLRPSDPSFAELSASRSVVVELCDLFAKRSIRATWATVGFLFASTKPELAPFLPATRPRYRQPELDPYGEQIGDDEESDPEHLAGSLVRLVASTPGQEVASHTFSHFYGLEDGQDEKSFRADLAAAQAIASGQGLHLTSLVLPRNQWNPRYTSAVLDNGFDSYRGPQPSWGHQAKQHDGHRALDRVARLVDTYAGVSPPPTMAWNQVQEDSGLCNVAASAFLRPFDPRRRLAEPLRQSRLRAGLRDAARRGRIFHLWWHPHNFSRHPQQSFALLNILFDEFDRLAGSEGMRSLSMRDVSETVRGYRTEPVGDDRGSAT